MILELEIMYTEIKRETIYEINGYIETHIT